MEETNAGAFLGNKVILFGTAKREFHRYEFGGAVVHNLQYDYRDLSLGSSDTIAKAFLVLRRTAELGNGFSPSQVGDF